MATTTTDVFVTDIEAQPLLFHLPREIRFFVNDTDENNKPTTPIQTDHDYYRKRTAVELCRFLAGALRENATTHCFQFEHDEDHELFARPLDKTIVAATEMADAFDKLNQRLDAKLTAQVAVSKKLRAENENEKKKKQQEQQQGGGGGGGDSSSTSSTSSAFVPTMEHFLEKLGMPEHQNQVFRFVCMFQINNVFEEMANSDSFAGARRGGRFRPLGNDPYRRQDSQHKFVSLRMLNSLFDYDQKNEGLFSIPNLMKLFDKKSKWVVERMLPTVSHPDETACCCNEALRLVLMGMPITPTQYHTLESPLMQECLAASPQFQASEAGKARAQALASKTEGGAGGGGGSDDALAGNRFRNALQKRDRKQKDSVLNVLSIMTGGGGEGEDGQGGGGGDHEDAAAAGGGGMKSREASAAMSMGDRVETGGPADPNAAEFKRVMSKGSMMDRADSAVDLGLSSPVEPDETGSFSAGDDNADKKKDQQQQQQQQEEETDDDKMRIPYKDDLSYLEDQFKLVTREKQLVKLKNKLRNFKGMEEGNGPDEDDIPAYRRQELRDQNTASKGVRLESEIRNAKTQVNIMQELCKSRLRATAKAGAWFPRLEILSEALELSRFEKYVVLYLVKSIIDPDQNADEYSFRGRGDRDTSVKGLQGQFCSSLEERMACRSCFYKGGTLIKEGILFVSENDFMQDLGDLEVDIDRRMLDFIVGIETEFSEMIDGSHLYVPNISIDDVILPEKDKHRVMEVVKNFEMTKRKRQEYGLDDKFQYGTGSCLLFYGKPGTGKTMLANAIGAVMKRKVLLINFPTLGTNSAGKIIKFLFREAKINKAILFFDECESLFMSRDSGSYHVNTVLTEMERHDGMTILATNRAAEIDDAMFRRINLAVEFKAPDHILREKIWRTLYPPKLPIADDVDFKELAMRFELTGGFIKNAWLGALGLMVAQKADKVTQADLIKSSQEQIVGRLSMSDFEHKVAPKVGLDSVICSKEIKESLRNIIDHSKAQSVLFGQWGFGSGHNVAKGVSALFCGAPGTGKTMASLALGFDLGKPVKMVNVAELMSKWVGETGKNIEAVFASAKNEDAVLVFDEAEGLFGSRGGSSSSCDRHDTLNVGLLLQFVENFSGICIVITNMKDAIDEAFFRRFRFVLNFEKPTADLRKKIWRSILPTECPIAADVNLEKLAEQHESTGGEIKQILLRAATRAALRDEKERRINMADLERACREESDKQKNKSNIAGMYI